MVIAVGILSILIIVFAGYILFLQLQLRSINRQLTKWLIEHTRQPVSLELINRELNALAANINKCLKAEELLRLDSIRREKSFKELIANISHDLRTPLTAIRGYQQLMEKGTLSGEQRQKLLIAQKHTGDLGRLIEHFFEYSYLVSADPELKRVRINLTNLVAECLAESVDSFEENNLTVHFEGEEPIIALADREMTVRIVQNLIRNCIQHSAGEVRVRLSAAKNAVICFSNPVVNSYGLDVEQLFERFYTSDKARSKSAGLGLSIVKLLAEQMGGGVSASLQEDIIEIRVELPLCKGD